MHLPNKKENGFIKMIVIFIILVATLSYFNINVSGFVESKPVQAVWSFTKTVYQKIVKPLLVYVWDNILHDFIYENVVDFFTKAEEQIGEVDIGSITSTTTPAN